MIPGRRYSYIISCTNCGYSGRGEQDYGQPRPSTTPCPTCGIPAKTRAEGYQTPQDEWAVR